MKVYTKVGDKGTTRRYNGEEVPKDEPVIVIGGKIDSVQASLDTAKVVLKNEEVISVLDKIQKKLWQTAGELSKGEDGDELKDTITAEDITEMESNIDKFNQKIDFFIRFSKETSARLNEARVRTRDLEIAMTPMFRDNKIREEVYKYINRLSDLLYVLACFEEKN